MLENAKKKKEKKKMGVQKLQEKCFSSLFVEKKCLPIFVIQSIFFRN